MTIEPLRGLADTVNYIDIVSQLEDEESDQLRELTNAAALSDGHEPLGEHKYLRMRRGDDLAVGLLAYERGTLVGYAHTLTYPDGPERRVSCELVVHPEKRSHGIGRALLRRSVLHAESERAKRLDFWAYNDSPASQHLALEFGLAPARRLLHMHRHAGPPAELPTPAHASIRAFCPGTDDEVWLALNNRIFSGHPENGRWGLDDLKSRMAQPWFRPQDLLLLEMDGKPAGFCWLKVNERVGEGRVGEIYIIGTLSDHHGVGLGRYLLSRGLTQLHEQKVDAVAVYVEQSNERAVALYWSFDFHHHHVDVCYSLPLPSPGRAPGGRGRLRAVV